ncbi:ABC transporter permease [Consotaella salsifontis]|uniref:Sulfonate transport system permease protein n=1 Tax=Consotaella salsifontis TaxID=1365950 RepID=A0A1T4T1F9_9HYPH|nr:ABC transporter permease [Consotaella salsifontis]SKA34242.1 sulfonate transport system permease protein [Consotaella salsifontis]
MSEMNMTDAAVRSGRQIWPQPRLRVPAKLVTLIVAIALWQIISLANDHLHFYNAVLVPSPWRIVAAGFALAKTGELFVHMGASLLRVAAGMAVAIPLGAGLALLVTSSRKAEVVLDPIIELLRPVPSLALLPVFIVWFGIGETTKMVFIAYSAFFIIFVTTVEAIRNIEPILFQAAGSLGLNRAQTYFHVTFKAALPQIMVGVRLALATSWFLIVGAEFLAANEGLGFLINFSRVWFQIDKMMVGAVVIGLLGLASNYLLLLLEARLFAWRERRA